MDDDITTWPYCYECSVKDTRVAELEKEIADLRRRLSEREVECEGRAMIEAELREALGR